jgi:hypothetical protein
MAKIRAYFRLDLYFFENPKVIDLSHAATVLYIASIAYANRRETDGFVAAPVLRRLIELDPGDEYPMSVDDLAHELVKAGLWEVVEGGFQIHDFLEHNDSSQDREDRREAERDRKRRERADAKKRPDGPDPPSRGPSGGVRSDKSGRAGGQNSPSAPIAVTEQSDKRASPTHPEELHPLRAVPTASVENPSITSRQPRRAKLVEPEPIGEAVTAIAGGRRPPTPTADQRRWREERDKRAAAQQLIAQDAAAEDGGA